MNEKAQIENYLDQKVNPLLEELLTNVIKSRPKNIVNLLSLSLISARIGSKKNQSIFRCSRTSPILTPTKTSTKQLN